MTDNIDTEWFCARLFAYRERTLDPAEAERFERMLETSPECRDLLEAAEVLERTEADTVDLIPTGVLARWQEMGPTLGAADRELVRQHLERSGEARQDLRLLGIEDPITDLAKDDVPAATDIRTRDVRDEQDLGEPLMARVRRWFWALGLYGATATAVIALLVVRLTQTRAPGVDGLSAPLHILRATRGANLPVITVASDAAHLVLSPAGQNLTADNPAIHVRLIGPDGDILHDSDADLSGSAESRRLIVVVPREDAWQAGRYSLSLQSPESGRVLAEYPFELEVR